MLNKISKIILTYFAYLPLFIILAITNIDDYRIIIASCVGLLAVGFISVSALFKSIHTVVSSKEKITVLEERNSEISGFIVTYIVPFIVMLSGVKQIMSFIILFFIIIYLYMATSLFCINPFLKIFYKYNVYQVLISNKKYFLLSKQTYSDSEKIQIPVKKMDARIIVEDD